MHFLGLATDYDGTLAEAGRVTKQTLAALQRFRQSGRKLILVTGRELPDLLRVFPEFALFEQIVAENGALLFDSATRKETPLSEPANAALAAWLSKRGVQPLSMGRSVIGTHEPHGQTALEGIRELGLEHQVIFNKGSVMILPPGVNKETGLRAALAELGLPPLNIVGVGDAENDHALLRYSGCAVAVASALPSLKEEADLIMKGGEGIGVVELIDMILRDDLETFRKGAFYFRGPAGKHNLRARNPKLFARLAEGVDEETWVYHLKRGDYSAWIRRALQDEALADEVSRIEQSRTPATRTRKAIREAIERKYTAAA